MVTPASWSGPLKCLPGSHSLQCFWADSLCLGQVPACVPLTDALLDQCQGTDQVRGPLALPLRSASTALPRNFIIGSSEVEVHPQNLHMRGAQAVQDTGIFPSL